MFIPICNIQTFYQKPNLFVQKKLNLFSVTSEGAGVRHSLCAQVRGIHTSPVSVIVSLCAELYLTISLHLTKASSH